MAEEPKRMTPEESERAFAKLAREMEPANQARRTIGNLERLARRELKAPKNPDRKTWQQIQDRAKDARSAIGAGDAALAFVLGVDLARLGMERHALDGINRQEGRSKAGHLTKERNRARLEVRNAEWRGWAERMRSPQKMSHVVRYLQEHHKVAKSKITIRRGLLDAHYKLPGRP